MTGSDQGSTTNINRSGGADFNAGRDITVGGDVVGRDKTTSVNTGGRAHVAGNVNVSRGGEFVVRDKNGVSLKVRALKIRE
jgi:hypothetical protein